MKTIRISGLNVSIQDNVVIVNGKRIDLKDEKEKEITVVVEGNVEKLEVDYCHQVEVKGNAGNIHTVSGDVRCGDVGGGVSTVSGDVHASRIDGSVSTVSGDIN